MTQLHEKNLEHSSKEAKERGQKVEANVGGSGHCFLCDFSSGTGGGLYDAGRRQERGDGQLLGGLCLASHSEKHEKQRTNNLDCEASKRCYFIPPDTIRASHNRPTSLTTQPRRRRRRRRSSAESSPLVCSLQCSLRVARDGCRCRDAMRLLQRSTSRSSFTRDSFLHLQRQPTHYCSRKA